MLFLVMDVWELANDLLGVVVAAKVNNSLADKQTPLVSTSAGVFTKEELAGLKASGAWSTIQAAQQRAEYLGRADAMRGAS